MLKYLNKKEEIDKYMEECKLYVNDYKKYSIYVHGYFLPLIDQKRRDGELKQGKYLQEVSRMLLIRRNKFITFW